MDIEISPVLRIAIQNHLNQYGQAQRESLEWLITSAISEGMMLVKDEVDALQGEAGSLFGEVLRLKELADEINK